ncbi:MAG: amidohydrolase [Marinilabiliales bacterium]|nr:MAG: amidohydrolase [Marinilabiliales bacterium]
MTNSCGPREYADTVFVNGIVYTMDEGSPTATAIAVKGNRFLMVGTDEAVMKHAGDDTRIVDLEGKTVLPGLTESHIHFGYVGVNILTAPLDVYWLPVDEMLERIRMAAERAAPGEWIVARGYNDAIWDEPAHRRLLDRASPNNPVSLRRYCGHATFVNTRALEIAGITRTTPDPDAGTIVRDAGGNATGVLVSAAGALVNRHIPPPPRLTEQEMMEAYKLGSDAMLANGITTVHDATGTTPEDTRRRKKAYEEGYLRVRIMDAVLFETAMEMDGPLTGLYEDHYTVRWVKEFVDGSLGGRGAAMIEPYDDMPSETGALRALGQDEDEYARRVALMLEKGFGTRTHSIGDRGNRITLNAFEKAMEMTGIKGDEARLVVEHAQVLHPDDIPRFGKSGIIASMQGVHATEDMVFVEERIGNERAKGSYAWRSILDNGGIISGGSDYGVSPYEPFFGMHAFVTRQDRQNNPPGGWLPEQKLTREEALKAYTVWPAFLEFSEHLKGRVKEGMLADFIVIDRDYFNIPAEEIHEIQVLRTVLGGETVFER